LSATEVFEVVRDAVYGDAADVKSAAEDDAADVGDIRTAVLPSGTTQAIGTEFVEAVLDALPEEPGL